MSTLLCTLLSVRAYTTSSGTIGQLLNRLYQKIEQTTQQDPHPGLMIASHHFIDPYPIVNEIDLLSSAIMDLNIQYSYPTIESYAKFTILYTMKRSYSEEVTFTLGEAIPLTTQDGVLTPMSEVYAYINRYVQKYSEIYDLDYVGITIRVYMEGKKKDRTSQSLEDRDRILSSIIEGGFREIEPIRAKEIKNRKCSYPSHITELKACRTELKPFIVADTETILLDNVHKPYAAGMKMVRPREEFNVIMIET